MIIAIDGPSGAGKSSVAKQVAGELGIQYLDTGAMYRAVTVLALQRGVGVTDDAELAKLAALPINVQNNPNESAVTKITIDGQDVTGLIRNQEINDNVTPVCQQEHVRAELVAQQQKIGSGGDFAVDGRDIATVVFPDAEVKIYLDAEPEVRARRRYEQDLANGKDVTFEEELESINRRDEADKNRQISPLRAADNATLIDSTHMTQDQVAAQIADLARRFL